MQQLLAAGGHQLTGASDGGEVVVLQMGSRFLQLLLQGAGILQLGVIASPDALPVEAEGTEPHNRNPKTGEHPGADAMQPGQQGGLALHPPGGEGALQHLQGCRASTPTPGRIGTAKGSVR